MKVASAAVVGFCMVVAMVTTKSVPKKRFISIHEITHGLHHLGHEIEHGVQHLGHELSHITGIHNARDLACKIYPHVKGVGEAACDAKCVALVTATTAVYMAPICPAACHMIIREAGKLAHC